MPRFLLALVFLTYLSVPAAAGRAGNDPVIKAAREELDRNYSKLKNSEPVPMYYMQFRAVDDFNITLNSYMGSPRQPSESRVRYASVLPRYNDYTFDNTHQLKGGYYNKYENLLKYGYLPVDDAPVPLETAVWNIINAGVKDQYDKYIKVKANYDSTSAERDGAPDFSVSGPVKYYSVLKPQKINRAAWQAALDRTTAVFSEFPKALNGSAQFKYDLFSKYNADTDGSAVREDAGFGSVSVDVTALTDDGMLLSRGKNYISPDGIKDLPSEEQLVKDAKTAVKELSELLRAKPAEPYSGPVLFKNRAAAVFFLMTAGHNFESHTQKFENKPRIFEGKTGRKVTADFISIYDRPLLKKYKGLRLAGHYMVDDEAVRAENVTLIKNGVLRNLLTGRANAKGFPVSNGHARAMPEFIAGPAPSNFIIESSRKKTFGELRSELVEECKKQNKEYGIMITESDDDGNPAMAYKVYADGRKDELIRGAKISAVPLANLEKIIDAGDDDEAVNLYGQTDFSYFMPMSAASPSLLLSEIEISIAEKSSDKQPLLPSPFAENGHKEGGK